MRVWTSSDRERFTVSAAPEAIAAHLRDARAEHVRIADHVSWLEVLLARRCRQVADGTWPPATAGAGAGEQA